MKVSFLVQDIMSQPKRETWLKKTCRELLSRMQTKFKMGRVQYGSDFGNQTVDFLLDQIEQEAIDQLMYVRELKRRRSDTIHIQPELSNVKSRSE